MIELPRKTKEPSILSNTNSQLDKLPLPSLYKYRLDAYPAKHVFVFSSIID